mmetsp:Transcript_25052/g.49019  ORF Transcript_25052/g.49019 Transcript_25052/m.49019 type:complete len:96 (+) Transcript_25052:103-390(+)
MNERRREKQKDKLEHERVTHENSPSNLKEGVHTSGGGVYVRSPSHTPGRTGKMHFAFSTRLQKSEREDTKAKFSKGTERDETIDIQEGKRSPSMN